MKYQADGYPYPRFFARVNVLPPGGPLGQLVKVLRYFSTHPQIFFWNYLASDMDRPATSSNSPRNLSGCNVAEKEFIFAKAEL